MTDVVPSRTAVIIAARARSGGNGLFGPAEVPAPPDPELPVPPPPGDPRPSTESEPSPLSHAMTFRESRAVSTCDRVGTQAAATAMWIRTTVPSADDRNRVRSES
jgi:hypothetical protein